MLYCTTANQFFLLRNKRLAIDHSRSMPLAGAIPTEYFFEIRLENVDGAFIQRLEIFEIKIFGEKLQNRNVSRSETKESEKRSVQEFTCIP